MKIIEKFLGAILNIIALVLEVVIEFTEEIKGVLIFMFETILFLFLILTIPVWILPYTLMIKHREKKNENGLKARL